MLFQYTLHNLLLLVILLFIGLGPTLYLRKVFKVDSVLDLILYSLVSGTLLSIFTFLTVGMFGSDILGDKFFFILFLLIVTSILLNIYLYISGELKFLKNVKFFEKSVTRVDYIVYVILFVSFVFVSLTNAKIYLYQTDELRYWLVDAKIIFETGFLRNNADIISNNAYSSFMTMHFAMIYKLFGKVVEQYSAFVSIFYLFLSGYLLYNLTKRMNSEVKIFGMVIISSSLIIYGQQVFFAYADIALSFYIFLSALLITRKVKLEDYPKKIFILSLTILATSFVKLPTLQFSPYSIILFFSWVIYDRNQILQLLKSKHMIKIQNLVLIFSPLLILLSNWYYRKYILSFIPFYSGSEPELADKFANFLAEKDISKVVRYIPFLLEFLWDLHILLLIFFLSLWTMLIVYLVKKYRSSGSIRQLLDDKKVVLYSVIVLVFPLLNIAFYATKFRRSQMERYLMASLFVGVALYIYLYSKDILSRYKRILIVIFLGLLIYSIPDSYMFSKGLFVTNTKTGEYSDFIRFEEKAQNSEDIRKMIGEDDLIVARLQFHCRSKTEHCVANISNNLNPYKYFLHEKNQGKLFSVLTDEFPDYMYESDAEYLLVEVGFGFAQQFNTDGDYDKFYHLYKFNRDDKSFEYIKGYEDYEYVE